MRTGLAYFLGGFLLSGCSNISPDEKLCRAEISAGLMNPETAEFHEFAKLSEPSAIEVFHEFRSKAYKTKFPALQFNDAVMKQVSANQVTYWIKEGGYWASLRVRAEGRLGNRITDNYLCMGNHEACQCGNEQIFLEIVK